MPKAKSKSVHMNQEGNTVSPARALFLTQERNLFEGRIVLFKHRLRENFLKFKKITGLTKCGAKSMTKTQEKNFNYALRAAQRVNDFQKAIHVLETEENMLSNACEEKLKHLHSMENNLKGSRNSAVPNDSVDQKRQNFENQCELRYEKIDELIESWSSLYKTCDLLNTIMKTKSEVIELKQIGVVEELTRAGVSQEIIDGTMVL